MAGQQPQRGFGNQHSGQPSVPGYGKAQDDDEYTRACSYVQEQLRAQLGGQLPAWDGPIPGFWDRADNQQNQYSTTINPEQGQHMPETSRAQFHGQEQFRASQQGDHRASYGGPATGMQQNPGLFGHQQAQKGMPGPNVGQGQPATFAQVRNQHGHAPGQSNSKLYSPQTNQGGKKNN